MHLCPRDLQKAHGSQRPTKSPCALTGSPEPPRPGVWRASLLPATQCFVSLPLGLRPGSPVGNLSAPFSAGWCPFFKHIDTHILSAHPCRSFSRQQPLGASPLDLSSHPFQRAGIGEAVWGALQLYAPEKKIDPLHFPQEGATLQPKNQNMGSQGPLILLWAVSTGQCILHPKEHKTFLAWSTHGIQTHRRAVEV